MKTGHELFVRNVRHAGCRASACHPLEQLDNDSTNSQLKKAFSSHRKETEGQVERLAKCFQLLGEKPQQSECAGIKGIISGEKELHGGGSSRRHSRCFSAIKAETYEICEYEFRIDMAREMKHSQVAKLLNQNLKEEKAALKQMEGFEKKIKPDQMMDEEQESRARESSRPKRKRAA